MKFLRYILNLFYSGSSSFFFLLGLLTIKLQLLLFFFPTLMKPLRRVGVASLPLSFDVTMFSS
jgi:hypothetical protein